jgi:hypothetical protein
MSLPFLEHQLMLKTSQKESLRALVMTTKSLPGQFKLMIIQSPLMSSMTNSLTLKHPSNISVTLINLTFLHLLISPTDTLLAIVRHHTPYILLADTQAGVPYPTTAVSAGVHHPPIILVFLLLLSQALPFHVLVAILPNLILIFAKSAAYKAIQLSTIPLLN